MINDPAPKQNQVEVVNIKVEIGKPEDWETYKKIRLESLEKAPTAFNDTYQNATERTEEEWQNRLAKSSSIIFIAKNGLEPVGLAGVIKEETEDVWKLVSVYVSPNLRGQGIFKKIFKEILNEVKKRGGKKIVLEVNPEQTNAVETYKALGFTMLRELKDVRLRNNRMTSSYEMELVLKNIDRK